ncbi:MAG: MopE-related protein, partial [Myxococcota bacterium]|nr:MopE-related protein [Myxococcota bacterium]
PGNLEVCDGVDNDCNGAMDDEDLNLDLNSAFIYYIDLDGDGYGNSETGLLRCSEEEGHVLNGEDCDDENASIHPQADEVCDTIDNDCDGLIDLDDDSMDPGSSSVYYLDADGDGYGDDSLSLDACIPPEGYVMLSGDCDDTNSSVSPVADEICDEIDNDCNDLIDANDPNVTAYGTGVSQTCAAETCKVIMDDGYSSGDGYYWIDPASSGAFEVYCDMSTDGGGWSIMVQNLNFPTTNIYDEYDYADFCDSYGMIYAGREIENSASWLAQKRMLWNTNHNLRQNGWPNGWIVSYEMGGSLAMPMFRTTAGLQSIFDGTLVSLPPNIVGDRCDPGGGEYLCGYWYDAGWSDSDLSVYPDPEDWASAYNHEETYISCMFR